MSIQGGLVFEADKTFCKRDLYIENGVFVSSPQEVSDTTVIQANDCYVLPGLIDIHSHGACGHDFSDADENGMTKILAYEYAHGITFYCPTSMTVEKEKLLRIYQTASQIPQIPHAASIIGFHMEGPFIDVEKKGAQKEAHILAPDISFFKTCNALCKQQIKLVTLSPKAPNALSFIKELHQEVTISLGHTSADYEISKEAFAAGATHVTHLFNAMPPLSHRSPGLIGAASEHPDCYAELICDGIHVHESMVRAAFKLFPDRIVLISDSIRATGMPDGYYELGEQNVCVKGKHAFLADGTIAGSVTNLYDCMLTAMSYGIPATEAIAAATIHPAKSIGIFDSVGSLDVGKKAALLLADKQFHLLQVIS